MKKNLLKSIYLIGSSMFLYSTLCIGGLHAQNTVPEETDYTVSSWTLYQRAIKEAESRFLKSKDYPYNVNVVINGDPSTRIGATWFTNDGVTGGSLQLVRGKTTDPSDFNTPLREIGATYNVVANLNYNVPANKLKDLAGFADNLKKNYISNKVLIDNLEPNTTY